MKIYTWLPAVIFIFGITAANPSKVNAQGLNVQDDVVSFTFWGGHSFNSIKFLGRTPDSQSSIFGIGFKKRIKSYPNKARLYYTADFIPYVEYHYPKRDENNKRAFRKGFGLSPVGFQLQKASGTVFQPYIQATGGTIYMNATFPTDRARRLNFTFDFTVGTDILISGRKYLTLGYKFHHISNGQTGKENPGLDSNFLFLSFLF